jgi:hypothetical protein
MIGRFLLSLSAMITLLIAVPASACMADGPEGYVSGLIWENRHTNIPDGAMVLKVEVRRPHPELPSGLVATVIEGPVDLVGSTVTIVPAARNSCVGLGRLAGYVVVRERPTQSEEAPGVSFFLAVDYLPDARDRSRGMKRESNWFYPGAPAPDLLHELPR